MLDFVILFLFLAALVGAFLFLRSRRPGNRSYLFASAVALGAGFLLVWVTGAVGIIGSSANDANLLYAGVLAAGFVGALLARFRPAGMARAMVAAAVAQVVVGVIALAAGLGEGGAAWPRDVLGATVFFGGLWLVAASLYRSAGREGVNP